MKLSAEIINTIRFFVMMIVFSFIVFMAYSSEKKILEKFRKDKDVPGVTSITE